MVAAHDVASRVLVQHHKSREESRMLRIKPSLVFGLVALLGLVAALGAFAASGSHATVASNNNAGLTVPSGNMSMNVNYKGSPATGVGSSANVAFANLK